MECVLAPPATLAERKRDGSLLVAAAIVLTVAFTTLAVLEDAPWTRLLGVFLVTGVLAAVGLRGVVAARWGRLLYDERRRRATSRRAVETCGQDATSATATTASTSPPTFVAESWASK